jgi:hypothetical protein
MSKVGAEFGLQELFRQSSLWEIVDAYTPT